jgi:hypothetical protein
LPRNIESGAILSDPFRKKTGHASKRWVNLNDSVTQNSTSLPMLPNSRFRSFALLCIAVVILSLVSISSRLDGYFAIIPIHNPLSSSQASSITTPPNITRSLVIPRLAEEDTGWVAQFLGGDPLLTLAIYTVDDPNAELTVPQNKGHEVMVYLTYIIDHYHNLSDITLFMHSHQIAWHNNDLLDSSAVNIVRRLNSHKVIRDGYMNLRCHHDPGCPDHIHPVLDKESSDDTLNIPEATVIGKAWLELFPDATTPPKVLSQPCCAQFAVSKDRIQTIPLSQYVFYRDWLFHTPLEDKLSGRVWEYIWQYIFGGVEELCPMESVCYCDGYGICFEGEAEYQQWFALRKRSRALQEELHIGTGQSNEVELMSEIGHIALDLQNRKNNAFERGKDPQIRALMAGRPWKDGDGF